MRTAPGRIVATLSVHPFALACTSFAVTVLAILNSASVAGAIG